MTTNKPKVNRYDCTSGRANICYGCYTMTKDEYGDYVSAEDYDALQAECDHLISLLKNCHSIVKAHAGASHMLDGFRPRRNQYDDLVDQVEVAIDAAMQELNP